ncbi:DNA cytosine methyltransferase [Streptomyces malaysiensis]|uniref:Phage DNA methylase n=1 Tax=Streptomyces malaysiensis TaxID=92644 RepID=A0A7X6AYB3_STRMQ|nr:DNA cytosine methyltransferase [Streptomyces malaysiensis]NIY66560.1 Phage DNA methylase [Streptomyces malaysiensis]
MTQPTHIPRWRRPRLLDTFCCAGGMAMGFHLAGFDVVGVDIEPQPEYPFTFVQGDAIDYIREHGAEFDLIHASPPCQAWSPLNAYNHKTYPELIAPAREAIRTTGRPYIIENVEAAREQLIDPVMLCGPMFGLNLYRHRLFETSLPLVPPPHRAHGALCVRNGYLPTPERPFMTITGGRHSKAWQRAAAHAMGTPWITTVRGVCEAIPPAYSQWIGRTFLTCAWEVAA